MLFGVQDIARATDVTFEAGDKIGLYVVNYDGQQAGDLQNTGNHVNNMRFVYNSSWTPDRSYQRCGNEDRFCITLFCIGKRVWLYF